jgi:hypothetical protein
MIREILDEIRTFFKTSPPKYDKQISTLSDWEIRRLERESRKLEVFNRAKGSCEACGMKLSIYIPPVLAHIHHKIFKSRGGNDSLDNLEFLCPYCHMQRHPKQKNLIGTHAYGKRNLLTVNQKLRWDDREYQKVGKIEYLKEDTVFEEFKRFRIDGKWGFVNENRKIVIKPVFDDAFPFSEGLAAVKINDKWGYINEDGKMVINPQFDETYGFSDGLAEAWVDGQYGWVDYFGRYIWEPKKKRRYKPLTPSEKQVKIIKMKMKQIEKKIERYEKDVTERLEVWETVNWDCIPEWEKREFVRKAREYPWTFDMEKELNKLISRYQKSE